MWEPDPVQIDWVSQTPLYFSNFPKAFDPVDHRTGHNSDGRSCHCVQKLATVNEHFLLQSESCILDLRILRWLHFAAFVKFTTWGGSFDCCRLAAQWLRIFAQVFSLNAYSVCSSFNRMQSHMSHQQREKEIRWIWKAKALDALQRFHTIPQHPHIVHQT